MYNKTIVNTLNTNEKFMKNVNLFLTKEITFDGEYWDAVRNYVTMVTRLKEAGGYKDINEEVEYQFASNNYPERDNQRMYNSILKFSPKKVFLCNSFKDVRNEVFTALSGAEYVATCNTVCKKCNLPQTKCSRCKGSKLPNSVPVIVVGSHVLCS